MKLFIQGLRISIVISFTLAWSVWAQSQGELLMNVDLEIDMSSPKDLTPSQRDLLKSLSDGDRAEYLGKRAAQKYCKEKQGKNYLKAFYWQRTKDEGQSNPYEVSHIVCDDDAPKTKYGRVSEGNDTLARQAIAHEIIEEARDRRQKMCRENKRCHRSIERYLEITYGETYERSKDLRRNPFQVTSMTDKPQDSSFQTEQHNSENAKGLAHR